MKPVHEWARSGTKEAQAPGHWPLRMPELPDLLDGLLSLSLVVPEALDRQTPIDYRLVARAADDRVSILRMDVPSQAEEGGPVLVSEGSTVSVALVVLFGLGVAARRRREDIGALAAATATALLGLGPLLVIINWVAAGVSFEIPTRYALSLVPAVIAVGVSAAHRPWQRWALASFAGLCCLVVLRHLVFF